MLLTEEEAKTKWCPKYQASAAEGADNRPLGKGPDGRLDINTMHRDSCCIASACMAWRQSGGQKYEIGAAEIDVWTKAGWLVAGIKDGNATVIMPIRGYCGLAGKPE